MFSFIRFFELRTRKEQKNGRGQTDKKNSAAYRTDDRIIRVKRSMKVNRAMLSIGCSLDAKNALNRKLRNERDVIGLLTHGLKGEHNGKIELNAFFSE